MPDKYDKEKLIEWINKKWVGDKVCPLCKQNNWGLSDHISWISHMHEKGMALGGEFHPLILVTCNNCGGDYALDKEYSMAYIVS